MASLNSRRTLLARWTPPIRMSGAIATLISSSLSLFPAVPSLAGGLGGAWSQWLPSGATSPTACLSRSRQFLTEQRLLRVESNGTVSYGDVNSSRNISVFMICSDLGDRVLLLVSSRDVSDAELQRTRTNMANSFRTQP
jgi:hypothetical protein